MTPDRKIIARTQEVFAERRAGLEEAQLRRRSELYALAPEVEKIDESLRALGAEIGLSAFAPDAVERIARIRTRSAELREHRARILSKLGLSPEPSVLCAKCGDSGVLSDGSFCDCFREEYAAQTLRYLNAKMPVRNAAFSDFDPRVFSAVEDPEMGVSPRQAAAAHKDVCSEFSEHFDETHENLYLCGPSACGKSYLAAAIAARCAERGFSVEYVQAFDLCSAMEEKRFGRADDEAFAMVDSCFSVDLLIIDDLGCEATTSFTGPSLYNLISNRMSEHLSTVILSELSSEELSGRYMSQIASRIRNDYTNLFFIGTVRKN